MKNKIVVIILLFMMIGGGLIAQNTPVYVLPGKTYTVAPENDTMWVMNNYFFKKTIIAKKQLKICRQQNELYKKQNDTLQEIINQQKILIDTLKSDRDYYRENWNAAENDIETLGGMVNAQSQYTKIAIIVGSATTVTAFIVGFILGMK